MLLINLFGALGLFLLGMWLMTEGLKLAGGQALENLLGRWTKSRLRGFTSGVIITALVQSSSAVTIAAIGFVNASLMTFRQCIWVIFGSNVGTTLTAWLVTFFGFNVKIAAFTFPLLGLGAFMRVFSTNERIRAFGMALAGFGLLFMGIDALKENFSIFAADFSNAYTGSIILGVIAGCIMTILTQSSSAAIALILTAFASGFADLQIAAAAVIGANVGTTSTAIFAALGATPNARRLALAHVIFNVITAITALAFLPLFTDLSIQLGSEASNNPIIYLAAFHTLFNVLGVLLMLPIEPRMSLFLLRNYKSETPPNESFLDHNITSIPDIALRALTTETNWLFNKTSQQKLHKIITGKFKPKNKTKRVLAMDDIDKFIAKASEETLTQDQSSLFTTGLAINHHLQNSHQLVVQISEQIDLLQKNNTEIVSKISLWLKDISKFSKNLPHTDKTYQKETWENKLIEYRKLKRELLQAVVVDKLQIQSVDAALQIASLSRRYIEQLLQASDLLRDLPGTNSEKNTGQSTKPDDTDQKSTH